MYLRSRRFQKFRHRLRIHARQFIVTSLALTLFIVFSWMLWAAWLEDFGPDFSISFRSLKLTAVRTIVTLDTLDPDTSTVVAHLSTAISEPDLVFDSSVQAIIPGLRSGLDLPPRAEYRVYYQKPAITDLSPIFGMFGLRMIPQISGHAQFDRIQGSLRTEPPPDRSEVLSIIGDPHYFPFDRYLILYELRDEAFFEYNKQTARIDSTSTVLPRFPGMVVHELSKQELEGWEGSLGKEFDKNLAAAKQQNVRKYNAEFWMEPGVALSVERPRYLRILTIVLGVVAVVSMVFVYRLSEPSKYFLNSLGAFAALWGVRSILTASAPKSPNVVDFVVLALFIAQIILVTARCLLISEKARALQPGQAPTKEP